MCTECINDCIFGCILCIIPCYTRQGSHGTSEFAAAPQLSRDQQAMMRDGYFWIAQCDNGADYEIDCADLRRLQSKSRWNKTKSGSSTAAAVSLAHAHATLADVLEREPDEQQSAAIARLRDAFKVGKSALTPDLFIKAASDLDTALFDGQIKVRVTISWSDMHFFKTLALRGTCSTSLGSKKTHIRLNKAYFFLDSKETLWGTLIHEMLHAYLLLATQQDRQIGTDAHDEGFLMTVERIVARLDFKGLKVKDVME